MKTFTLFAAALLSGASGSLSAKTIEIEVNGLVCAFCAQGIEKTLRGFEATEDVLVSLEHRLVAVSLQDGATLDEAVLKQAIVDAGYTPVNVEYTDATLDDLRATLAGRADDDD